MEIIEYSGQHKAGVVELMALLQDHEAEIELSRPPGREIAEPHFEYLLDCCRQHNGRVYVSLHGSRVSGFVVVLIESEDVDDRHLYESFKTFGLVTDLAVAVDYRGSGVAQELMLVAEQYVKSMGISTLHVSALTNNAAANSFYRKAGYRSYQVTYIKDL